MTLELDSYYQNMASKGRRSASICAPGLNPMELAAIRRGSTQHNHQQQQQQHTYQQQEQHHYNHPNTTGSGSNIHNRENGQSSRNTLSMDEYTSNFHGSGGNMQIENGSTPTKPRKHTTAHRSQSARVVGSQRPKVKRREADIREYQQHLDLASSDGALAVDCQDVYNPFLRKVPSTGSTGRLITNSSSMEMNHQSNHSLHQNTPPPQQQQQAHPPRHLPVSPSHNKQQQQQQQQAPRISPPLEQTSPRITRRHSGSGRTTERRGSDYGCGGNYQQQNGNTMSIPVIATPTTSPCQSRRGSMKKPPKSPTGSPRGSISGPSGNRRANSVKVPRKTTQGWLEVPNNGGGGISPNGEEEDEDSYRLRTFNTTSKGIVNRGDSFRRRRSRSNSLIPTPTTPEAPRNTTFTSEDGLLLPFANEVISSTRSSPMPSPARTPNRPSPQPPSPSTSSEPESGGSYRVAMLGGKEVGRSSLVSQFMTSEGINAYDRCNEVEGEETVCVMLNGEESEMTFYKMNNLKTELNRASPPDAFILVYSVVDRSSFQKVEKELKQLQEWDLLRTKAIVVVANKIDLARSRTVTTNDGRCLSVANRVKFTEVSVGINHNVDELLVGLLNQIRLKNAQSGSSQENWCKHRGIVKASVKARQMLTWLLGKDDTKFKNCENFNIL